MYTARLLLQCITSEHISFCYLYLVCMLNWTQKGQGLYCLLVFFLVYQKSKMTTTREHIFIVSQTGKYINNVFLKRPQKHTWTQTVCQCRWISPFTDLVSISWIPTWLTQQDIQCSLAYTIGPYVEIVIKIFQYTILAKSKLDTSVLCKVMYKVYNFCLCWSWGHGIS